MYKLWKMFLKLNNRICITLGMIQTWPLDLTSFSWSHRLPRWCGGKESACHSRRHKRCGFDPGVGNGNSLQYSCLENPMDRGAWRATAHRVSKSQTQLSMRTHMSFESKTGNSFWKTYNFSWSKIMSTVRMGLDNALSQSMITPVL